METSQPFGGVGLQTFPSMSSSEWDRRTAAKRVWVIWRVRKRHTFFLGGGGGCFVSGAQLHSFSTNHVIISPNGWYVKRATGSRRRKRVNNVVHCGKIEKGEETRTQERAGTQGNDAAGEGGHPLWGITFLARVAFDIPPSLPCHLLFYPLLLFSCVPFFYFPSSYPHRRTAQMERSATRSMERKEKVAQQKLRMTKTKAKIFE